LPPPLTRRRVRLQSRLTKLPPMEQLMFLLLLRLLLLPRFLLPAQRHPHKHSEQALVPVFQPAGTSA
jgi:hypothetical protein